MPLPGVSREGLLDLSPARSSPFLLVVRDDDFPLTTRSAARLSPKGSSCCAALSGFRHLPRPQGVVPRSSPLRAFGVSALARPILPWAWFLSAGPDLRGVQPLVRRGIRALVPANRAPLGASIHTGLERRVLLWLLVVSGSMTKGISPSQHRLVDHLASMRRPRRTCPSRHGATPVSRPSPPPSPVHRSEPCWR